MRPMRLGMLTHNEDKETAVSEENAPCELCSASRKCLLVEVSVPAGDGYEGNAHSSYAATVLGGVG